MARGKSNVIQVKSADTSEDKVINLVKLSKKVIGDTHNVEMSEHLEKILPEDLKLDLRSLVSADDLTNAGNEDDSACAAKKISQSPKVFQKSVTDDQCEVQLQNDGPAPKATDISEPNLMIDAQTVDGTFTEVGIKEEKEPTKKKRKNKKKNNKNKKKANVDTDAPEDEKEAETEVTRPARLAPIKKAGTVNVDAKTDEQREINNTGCFGFIASWFVKRKEKRRAKKRKAIEARKSRSVENLVVYGNRRSKGGVAFTVELDNRPIDRSVLPPIKKRPGPIRMATEQKLETAESLRKEIINKKREAARAHSRLVRETADRRAHNEEHFRQSTHNKVVRKGNKADESRQVNKTIETARAHSRLVRETADKRAHNEAEFKQATLYKVLLKEEAASKRLQQAREDQRSRCASRCVTRCASRMESARRINADYGTFLEN